MWMNLNNPYFDDYANVVFSRELKMKYTTDCSASYLDVQFNKRLHLNLIDKRDDFSFSIINFPLYAAIYLIVLIIMYDIACFN